jgi:hypothetical protein
MVPTDNQLNGLFHEACGKPICVESGVIYDFPDDVMCYLPNYCADRNLLPEVLDAVEAAGPHVWKNFVRIVVEWTECSLSATYRAMKATPRQQVEAALIALGKWQDDWKEER